jgi:hypothetical protein
MRVDPDDALDESAVVLIVVPRAHIAKRWELAARVRVEVRVRLVRTAERVNELGVGHGTNLPPSGRFPRVRPVPPGSLAPMITSHTKDAPLTNGSLRRILATALQEAADALREGGSTTN